MFLAALIQLTANAGDEILPKLPLQGSSRRSAESYHEQGLILSLENDSIGSICLFQAICPEHYSQIHHQNPIKLLLNLH
jgi:hypothetical protein